MERMTLKMRSEDFIESLHNISEVADTDVKEKVQK